MKFETRAVQTGTHKDDTFNSVITPIYQTSTFYFDEIGVNKGFDYTRSDNPTRLALEENIASLENGSACRVTASGMAAISTAMFMFKPGDHIISSRDIYGGTYRLFTNILTGMGYDITLIDMRDPQNVRDAITPKTRCIWIETPSNPLLRVTDIKAVTSIAKEHGIVTIADNTFLSPYFQRPLDLGVDIVVHSTTKYINGHSDIIGGAIITSDPEHTKKIRTLTNALGTTGSPFDAWLQLRGVKTLPMRMEAHQRNAFEIARFLEKHPKITKLYYNGLETDPQHDLAKSQTTGFGGIVTFVIDAPETSMNTFFKNLKIFHLSASLGGVESLICHPWTITHAAMPPEKKLEYDITPTTIRISAGIENPIDLVEALSTALDAV